MSGLPNLWGEGWIPQKPLDLKIKINPEIAKTEFLRFLVERHEGHLQIALSSWEKIISKNKTESFNGNSWNEFSKELVELICELIINRTKSTELKKLEEIEIIPRRNLKQYLSRKCKRLSIDLHLALRRIAYYHTISVDLRKEWHRLMIRTRCTDEHLKSLFIEGVDTPDGEKFGGKGFRSTWQETVVSVASALDKTKDRVAPMIRDMGLSLAMGDTPLNVMAAQMGKVGSPMNGGQKFAGGRDLHIGSWNHGILPPTAPLPIASATITGLALASKRLNENRFHVAMIGEGASSSGEWWEAINFAGVRGLPICYILQNNQIALDTFSTNQSAVDVWADKAVAMGVPSWTIDGSDPAAYYSSVATAREFSLNGGGATLIHVETMRGCGHAHHHDDLYLGSPSGNPPGYVDKETLEYWSKKDPLELHEKLLIRLKISETEIKEIFTQESTIVDNARKDVEAMDWPNPESVTKGITTLHDADTHEDHLKRIKNSTLVTQLNPLQIGETSIKFSNEPNSWTYSRAIQQGLVRIAEIYGDSTIFMGEDMEVAGAFGMNIPLRNKGHEEKLLDMPLSEAIIIHSATGAALGGLRPIAEIQFGGFAALAFNALINNTAMIRWRWGNSVPLTVRIPLGGKTRSGPFHANMIESWFSNDPGLIVVAPSNPQDAYDLLVESAKINDPVIYLEHIGLYGLRGGKTGWGDSINQIVNTSNIEKYLNLSETYKIGKAEIIRGGNNLTIISWGSMVHVAMKAANHVETNGIQVEIIDLRTLIPFDVKTVVGSVSKTGRVIILQEAQWSGGIGHTIQSRIIEECFWSLETTPIVIGSLDTPVPFSPPLEDHTIVSENHVIDAIKILMEN
ncbi:MAG: hypothetical protein CMB56_001795 [Methanobacteriota archaeon]|nr:MAG: hypothetical protein CMB56_001795 [Euryarchaeota archaeon]